MKCEECSELLDLYINGELSDEERQEVDAHLSSCQQCREELAFAKKLQKELSSMPKPAVPEHFFEDVRAKIEAEKHQAKRETFFSYFRMSRVAPVLAAALLVGVFLKVDMLKLSKDTIAESDEQIVMGTVAPSVSPEQAETESLEALPEQTPETTETAEAPTAAPSQAPTATPKPTKSPKPTATPAATARASRTAEARQTAAPATQKSAENAAPASLDQGENEVEVQAFSAPAAVESEQRGGGGGAAANTARKSTAADLSVGRVAVSQDQLSDAKNIAGKYGDYKNRVYEMSKSEMNQFLNDLEQNGISYKNRAGTQANVKFQIVAE